MLCIWFYLVLSVLLCLFVSQKGWIMYMLHTTVPSLEEEDCALTSQMRRCRSAWREHLSWWRSITIKNHQEPATFLSFFGGPNMTKGPNTTTWYTMPFSNCGMLRCCHLNLRDKLPHVFPGFQPHMTLAKTSRAHDGARIPESCWQDRMARSCWLLTYVFHAVSGFHDFDGSHRTHGAYACHLWYSWWCSQGSWSS